jgi:hypothetical protein
MDLETRMKAWDRKFYALTSFPQVRTLCWKLCRTMLLHSVNNAASLHYKFQ